MSDNRTYDPYIPPAGGSSGSGGRSGGGPQNPKIQNLKAQVDDAVGVMRDNIDEATKRGERLDDLQTRTDKLAESARTFTNSAHKVRKTMWWKDMKMRIIIGVAVVIILIIIIVPIVKSVK